MVASVSGFTHVDLKMGSSIALGAVITSENRKKLASDNAILTVFDD